MNNPPEESLLGHYLLENPWPVGLLSVAVGGILALLWMRQGDGRLAIAAGVALLVSAIVFLVEAVVVTPAEHGTILVRSIVRSAEEGDPEAIIRLLDGNASLHMGSLENSGRPLEDLEDSIRSLERSNRITDNWITNLRGTTLGSDRAIIHLGCLTTTERSYGSTPTTWIFDIRRTPEGDWLVRRIAFESLMGRTPERPLR